MQCEPQGGRKWACSLSYRLESPSEGRESRESREGRRSLGVDRRKHREYL